MQASAHKAAGTNDIMQSIMFTIVLKSSHVMQVYDAITRHVDWEVVKCLVIAGPGFTKDSFKTFLEAEAVRQDNR